MKLQIFDVQHGACALLSADDGSHMMIDCGSNADTGWTPAKYLWNHDIYTLRMLAITNYDEDHTRGLPELRKQAGIEWLHRNRSVGPDDLKKLKSEYGMGRGIEELVAMTKQYTGSGTDAPMQPFPGISFQTFCNSYPSDFTDENNLSMVLGLDLYGHRFLFPGDLERSGWEKLLGNDPSFRQYVSRIDVLVAAHHGRESGIYEPLFETYGCNPWWVVISDCGYKFDTQKTVPIYRTYAKGARFRGEERHVLTTRKDGSIEFSISSSSWNAF